MGDTKITLRISEVELDEIDDFVARHPEYHNRSQLIRHGVMEFMKMVERGEFRQSKKGFCVEMDGMLIRTLEDYVDYGYFDSIDQLIKYVLTTISANGILGNILRSYVNAIHKDLRLDPELLREKRVGRRYKD